MVNARKEFQNHTEGKQIKCAYICSGEYVCNPFKKILTVGHNHNEYKFFLESLDFDYDNGYGGQELFGAIWYKDGSWSSRGEYDGSEWWEHNQLPEIPKELKGEK